MGPKQLEDQIADRYQLMEPIGRGGSGVVWRAQDLLLERQVAMKELIPPVGIDEKDRRRLQQSVLREARAAARLHHPGAVSVYDVVNDAERLFIVMELVEAPDLSKVVNWNGPLDPSRAAAIGLELLEVLQVAHESRIIHRDVKPGNVLVPAEGRTRLSDFGIASFVDDPSVTATGILKGTPSYMSPEQAMGGTIGPATDLWSLGATLYFAVEGHAPFDKGGQPIPTMTAIALEEPQPFVRAGALGPVLESLFEKDPADRPVHEVLRRSLQTVQGAGPGPDSSRRYSLGSEEAPYTEVFKVPPELRAPSSASVRPSTAAMDLLATPSTEATSDGFADDQDVAPAIEPAEPQSADLLDDPPVVEPAEIEAADLQSVVATGIEPDLNDPAGVESATATATAGVASATAGVELRGVDLRADEPVGVESHGRASVGVVPERVGVAPGPVGVEPEPVGVEPERVGVEPEPVGVETIAEGEPAEDDLPVGPSASVEPIVAQEARDRATSAAPATHQDAAVGDTAPMTYEASAEDHHVAAAGPEAAAGPDRPPLTTLSPRRRDSRPGARRWAAAAVIALLVVAGLVIVAQVGKDSTPKSAQTRPTTTPGANAPKIPATTAAKSPVATASKGQPAGGAVPAGWRSYSDPAGFQVAYPPTWSIRHDGTLTDFSDPATSTYLRIDHRSPPAPTPDGPWYELEPHFAASNPGYQRIGITRTTFHGYPAAVWEYTYLSGSLKLHAIDLGMIVGDHAFGFNFQTTDAAWTQMQPLLDSLENSFRP